MGSTRTKLAVVAGFVALIGGGVAGGLDCACVVPVLGGGTTGGTTTVGGGSWSPVASAKVGVSQSGNDSCTVNGSAVAPSALTSGHICKTWDKAFSIAGSGQTVAVFGAGGAFTADDTNSVTVSSDPGYGSDVTLGCGDLTPVTMVADQLWLDTNHIKVSGGCFQLQRIWVGDPPANFSSGKTCGHVTVDSLSMYMYDVAGCSNVTISNNTVGPDVSCFRVGTNGGFAECTNNASTHEQYFYARGEGNAQYTEPKLHPNGWGTAWSNVTISGNTTVGINTRDPVDLHGGGLQINCGSNLTMSGNTWQYDFAYDVGDFPKDNGGCSPATTSITGNTFGQAVNGLGTSTDYTSPTSDNQADLQVAGQDSNGCVTLTSWTMTGNVFTGGYDFNVDGCSSTSYPSLAINSNTGTFTYGQNPSQPQP